MRWVIYTDSLSSILAIENNRENHPTQLVLCKVPAHIAIKGNEETGNAAKQAIDMPGITMTRLPHTGYYLTIRRA